MSSRVSIGLPVYNGERYLVQAIDSLLAQDYEDFELIISDNASLDSTQEICLNYAAADSRVRYYRQETNIGAAKNFNLVLGLSTAPYFKWASHDDWCAPELLTRCVEVLDREPDSVLCCPRLVVVDEDGQFVAHDISIADDFSTDVRKRAKQVWSLEYITHLFGVMRTSALKQTGLFRSTSGSDKVLLAELSLLGNFRQILDDLLFYRVYRRARNEDWTAPGWWDPSMKGRIAIRSFTRCYYSLMAINRSPWPPTKKLGLAADTLVQFGFTERSKLFKDLSYAVKHIAVR